MIVNANNAKLCVFDKNGQEIQVYEGVITDMQATIEPVRNYGYGMSNITYSAGPRFVSVTMAISSAKVLPSHENTEIATETPEFKMEQIEKTIEL